MYKEVALSVFKWNEKHGKQKKMGDNKHRTIKVWNRCIYLGCDGVSNNHLRKYHGFIVHSITQLELSWSVTVTLNIRVFLFKQMLYYNLKKINTEFANIFNSKL